MQNKSVEHFSKTSALLPCGPHTNIPINAELGPLIWSQACVCYLHADEIIYSLLTYSGSNTPTSTSVNDILSTPPAGGGGSMSPQYGKPPIYPYSQQVRNITRKHPIYPYSQQVRNMFGTMWSVKDSIHSALLFVFQKLFHFHSLSFIHPSIR